MRRFIPDLSCPLSDQPAACPTEFHQGGRQRRTRRANGRRCQTNRDENNCDDQTRVVKHEGGTVVWKRIFFERRSSSLSTSPSLLRPFRPALLCIVVELTLKTRYKFPSSGLSEEWDEKDSSGLKEVNSLFGFYFLSSSRGLTFTWWECCGLCQRHKPTELAHSFLFCTCVCFCLYGHFNCISFHKFSRRLPAFSLCSSALNSALLVLSALYPSMKVFFGTDVILCGWLGLKHQLTNQLPVNSTVSPQHQQTHRKSIHF